ncbi:Hypothetical Protein FCC1311_035982 [Hondaea fermentalgiana]|uniref:Uncharacterized protein n=1 Tax=Hondaea fermentalgiana TaxID=2315210 RepID=A0A2R5G8I4_9STRA|nr:Hypothetical Protein FCC1311_035982 [Hondaea fermentalgiana]|eukprot:GBG27376.1 Hypothetical Protein FCC1311_035982 [Hondaea fermentalgiana]
MAAMKMAAMRVICVTLALASGVMASGECALDDARALALELEDVATASATCQTDAARVKGYVDHFLTNLDDLPDINDKAETLQATLVILDGVFDTVGPFVSRVQYLGPIVKEMGNVAGRIAIMVGNILNTTSSMEALQAPLQQASTSLAGIATSGEVTQIAVSEASALLNSAIACSDANSCASTSDIEAFGESIDLTVLASARAELVACNAALGSVSVVLDQDELPDLSSLDGINDFLGNFVAWVNGMVDELEESADYTMCCNDVLRTIKEILGEIEDIWNLATCWLDGAETGLVNERLDLQFGLFGLLVDKMNARVETLNTVVAAIDTSDLSIPEISLPSFSFVQGANGSCAFESGAGSLQVQDTTFDMAIAGVSPIVNEFDGSFDVGAIVDSIKLECSLAKAALEDDAEAVDCCDVARTCKASDRIVLYENTGCSGTLAGTLSVPDAGSRYALRTDAQQCTANDEAASVELVGPIPAGLRIEVGNNYEDLCSTDFYGYASIVLSAEIPEGETLCIPTFEQSGDFGAYKMALMMDGSLNGKISRYEVSRDDGETVVNRCVDPSTIVMHSDNACNGDNLGAFTAPGAGNSKTILADTLWTSGEFDTNRAESLRLVGPLKAGLLIELYDDRDGSVDEDTANLVLKVDLAAGEELCVPTLEDSSEWASYRLEASSGSSLDSDVSRMVLFSPSTAEVTLERFYGRAWTPEFSEENGGLSKWNGPIQGAFCSGNRCDNKHLLVAKSSSCRTTSTSRYTAWFSEEQSSVSWCSESEYVAGMQCSGSKCDNLRLICRPLADGCQWNGGAMTKYVDDNDTYENFGTKALRGVRCHQRYCGKLELRFATLTSSP